MTRHAVLSAAVICLLLPVGRAGATQPADGLQSPAGSGNAHLAPPQQPAATPPLPASPARGACGTVAAVPAPGVAPPPVAHARILDESGSLLAVSDASGNFCLPSAASASSASTSGPPPAEVGPVDGGGSVRADGYLPATWTPPPSQEFWSGQSWVITLEPLSGPALAAPAERVEVTAYRTPLAALDSPASTRALSAEALRQAAGVTLDSKLRLIPGFELFRRTSALVANPTTQGLSLRGLGSTAASRTLVVSDDVPLNDPYGGWIHWNELPSLAIDRVEVVRGGASDLYGSSAIGGVVNILAVHPADEAPSTALNPQLHLLTGYGAEATTDNAALGSLTRGRVGALAAAGLTATDGYTLVAPNLRGPVDQRSNVHAENALLELDRYTGAPGSGGRLFLRGNVLNENRHNGTPLQTNATRLWRYSAGVEQGHLAARAFGSSEHYYQSYSSIATGRTAETLTRTGEDPAGELGALARWTQPVLKNTLLVAGADLRDVRAEDISFPATQAPVQTTTARQRQAGVYAELLATPGPWTLSGSARLDHFTNGDAAKFGTATAGPLPSLSETVVDPRLGLSRRLTPTLALNASGFRAYRAPTENELYRTGQVGQQTTLANPSLRSERATGWEAGLAAAPLAGPLARSEMRASWFWTQVNRPITALTLATTPTATTLKRENLGQIESRGLSLDASVHPAVTFLAGSHLAMEGGYQYAIATVTSYAQQPALVGNWIPQVARHSATLQSTLSGERLGLLSLQARTSGRQYDDDQNRYVLHPFFRLDVYASHAVGQRLEAFASVENLLDRSIDAGRTPIRTLGTPQLARFGLRLNLGGESVTRSGH